MWRWMMIDCEYRNNKTTLWWKWYTCNTIYLTGIAYHGGVSMSGNHLHNTNMLLFAYISHYILLQCLFVHSTSVGSDGFTVIMNMTRHRARVIVSWPNPNQYLMSHISHLNMIEWWSIYICKIIKREMGKLRTHIFILHVQCFKISLHNNHNEIM